MEQFFVIIAIVVFWIVRGVAGTQRRVPGQDPYDGESVGPGGHIDISGTAKQKTLESQRRALDALQRWEAKQGLSRDQGGAAQPERLDSVPASSRTRVGRPATGRARAAAQQRKAAFADIARMLDPGQQKSSAPAAAKPAAVRIRSDAALRRDSVREDEAAQEEAASRKAAAVQETAASGRARKAEPLSALARLEQLPLAARAIVYSEILGRPRSLS